MQDKVSNKDFSIKRLVCRNKCCFCPKLRQLWCMCKEAMYPNMDEIEQRKLYQFNLNKAWIANTVTSSIKIINIIFGISEWQKGIESADKRMIED